MTSNICTSKAEWPGQGRQVWLRQTAWLSSNSRSWENVAVLHQDGEGARGSEDRRPDSQWSESRCGIKMLSQGSQGPLWLYESCLETILPPPQPLPRQAPHSRPVETGKAQTADHRGACCTVVVLKTKEERNCYAGWSLENLTHSTRVDKIAFLWPQTPRPDAGAAVLSCGGSRWSHSCPRSQCPRQWPCVWKLNLRAFSLGLRWVDPLSYWADTMASILLGNWLKLRLLHGHFANTTCRIRKRVNLENSEGEKMVQNSQWVATSFQKTKDILITE